MTVDSLPGSGMRVVSAVPGRIRLRATDPSARHALASVAEEVGTWDEVTSVLVRPRSASVVVRFSPELGDAVADSLLSLGVHLRAHGGPPVASDPGATIGAAAAAANRAVGRRLNGTDLRLLIPLGLGLLSARRAMRGDQRLAEAPWYVLAWYASETFLKFRRLAPSTAQSVDTKGD